MSAPEKIPATRLWITLVRAHGAIAAYAERAIIAQGLCMSDFMVLEVLLHKGRMPISAIGDKILLASASMTSAIDRVEQRGFVHRITCDSDRRIRYIELTPAGHKFISALFLQHERDLEFLAAGLSAVERKSLYEGLKKFGLTAKFANISATSLVEEIQPAPAQTRPNPGLASSSTESARAAKTPRRSHRPQHTDSR